MRIIKEIFRFVMEMGGIFFMLALGAGWLYLMWVIIKEVIDLIF